MTRPSDADLRLFEQALTGDDINRDFVLAQIGPRLVKAYRKVVKERDELQAKIAAYWDGDDEALAG